MHGYYTQQGYVGVVATIREVVNAFDVSYQVSHKMMLFASEEDYIDYLESQNEE